MSDSAPWNWDANEDQSVVGDVLQVATQPWSLFTDREMTDRWHLTYTEDTTQRDAEKRDAYARAKSKEVRPPNMTDATNHAIGSQVKDLQRRRASSTLLTTGQGTLDSAPTASSTLLGL